MELKLCSSSGIVIIWAEIKKNETNISIADQIYKPQLICRYTFRPTASENDFSLIHFHVKVETSEVL